MPALKKPALNRNFGPHFEELHKHSPIVHKVLLNKRGLSLSLENIVRFYAHYRPKTFHFYIRELVKNKDLEALTNIILLFRSESNKESRRIAIDVFKAIAKQDKELGKAILEHINMINSKKYLPSQKKAPGHTATPPQREALRHTPTPQQKEAPRHAPPQGAGAKVQTPVPQAQRKQLPPPKQEAHPQPKIMPKPEIKSIEIKPNRVQREAEINAHLNRLSVAHDFHPNPIDKKNFINFVLELEERLDGKFDIKKLFDRGVVEGLMKTLKTIPEFLELKQSAKVGDVTYGICNVIVPEDQHRMYVTIVTKKNDELNISVFYKSGSSNTWRLLPLITHFGGFEHYYKTRRTEQKLALPWQIQKIIDTSTVEGVAEEMLKNIEAVAPALNKFRIDPRYWREAMERIEGTVYGGINDTVIDLHNEDNLPDLSDLSKCRIDSWDSYSQIYGKSKKLVLPSRNRRYAWTIDVTRYGAFISSIEAVGGEISKYGLPTIPTILDPERLDFLLTSPPLEYTGQLYKIIRDKADNCEDLQLEYKLRHLLGEYSRLGIDARKISEDYVSVMPILLQHPLIKKLNEKLMPLLK